MKIILIGFKSSGKTTIGRSLSERLNIDFLDLDLLIEKRFLEEKGEAVSFREIFRKIGRDNFRELENSLLQEHVSVDSCLISLGGGTVDDKRNWKLLEDCCVVYIRVPIEDILSRIRQIGYPSYLDGSKDPEEDIRNLYVLREPVFEKISDIVIENPNSVEFKKLILDLTRKILNLVQNNDCN